MKESELKFRPRGKNVNFFLAGEIDEELTKRAKDGKRSKAKEIALRLKHHLELFPDLPCEALPDVY